MSDDEPPIPAALVALLEAIEADADAAEHREVLRDFLLQQEAHDEAEWLRLEAAHHAGSLDLDGRKRFVALDQVVHPALRARLSRARVEGCATRDAFAYDCPEQWSNMARTDDPQRRMCAVCNRGVHFVTSVEEARRVARDGSCVAIALGAERHPGDLTTPEEELLPVGSMPPPWDLDEEPVLAGKILPADDPEPSLADRVRGLFRRLWG
jgi:hypothetical protein